MEHVWWTSREIGTPYAARMSATRDVALFTSAGFRLMQTLNSIFSRMINGNDREHSGTFRKNLQDINNCTTFAARNDFL